jgi:Kef-type K+ transport system membrane component KefB
MTELHTGLLLGLYALIAGLYGLAYAAWRVLRSNAIGKTAAILAGCHVLVLMVIVICMPLGVGWKAILGAGSAFLICVPPLVWRLLQETHRQASPPP